MPLGVSKAASAWTLLWSCLEVSGVEQNSVLNALIKNAFVTVTNSSNASNLSATSSKSIVLTCAVKLRF